MSELALTTYILFSEEIKYASITIYSVLGLKPNILFIKKIKKIEIIK